MRCRFNIGHRFANQSLAAVDLIHAAHGICLSWTVTPTQRIVNVSWAHFVCVFIKKHFLSWLNYWPWKQISFRLSILFGMQTLISNCVPAANWHFVTVNAIFAKADFIGSHSICCNIVEFWKHEEKVFKLKASVWSKVKEHFTAYNVRFLVRHRWDVSSSERGFRDLRTASFPYISTEWLSRSSKLSLHNWSQPASPLMLLKAMVTWTPSSKWRLCCSFIILAQFSQTYFHLNTQSPALRDTIVVI